MSSLSAPANRCLFFARCAAVAVTFCAASAAPAQPRFQSGTGSITHYQRYDQTGIQRTPVAPNTNPFNLPVFNSSFFQYNSATHPSGNIVVGPLTSTARAGIGQQTSTSFFGIAFATGTNITQRGNADSTTNGASMLTLTFDGTWTVGPVALTGTTAGSFASFLGSLPSNTATFAQVNLTANFDWHPSGQTTFTPLRSPINATVVPRGGGSFYLRNTPGSFAGSPSDVVPTSPSTIPANATVHIYGTISYLIHNDGGEASTKTDPAIPFPNDALPPLGIAFAPVHAPLPSPVTNVDLTCPAPVTSLSFPLNGPTVRWGRFVLANPVTAANFNSLSIAASHLASSTHPVAIALYDAFGRLIASDEQNGFNGTYGQLSFGFGRQHGFQAGSADADGRNGDLDAGTYYIALANSGATFATNRFSVTPGPFSGNNTTAIIVRTNQPNCDSPIPIPPTPAPDLGDIAPSDSRSAPLALDPTGTTWVRFNLTAPIVPDRAGGFLTIDTAGTIGVDTIIGLYGSDGHPVSVNWVDDDSFGEGLSQLDFRQPGAAVGPNGPRHAVLNGYSGDTVPAGTYYLAVAPYRARFGTSFWEVQCDAPSAQTVTFNLRTGDVYAPIVDGYLDPAYGPPLALQRCGTGFGDSTLGLVNFANGSELDGCYARVQNGILYLLFAGNLESNFKKLEIFFDTRGGGQNQLRSDNPNVDFDGLNRMSGLRFDNGFSPDYWIGTTGGDPGTGQYAYFLNYAELLAGGGGAGYYVGTNNGRGGPLTGGNNPFGIAAAIDNFNSAGVTDELRGDGFDPSIPSAVATGMELAIPLAALGSPYTCCIVAFINSEPHDFVSNQFLQGFRQGAHNLGDPHLINLVETGQFCIDIPGLPPPPPPLCPADFNQDGSLNSDDLGDFITAYFNTPPDPRADFNGDGVINADDLGDFITAYFNGC